MRETRPNNGLHQTGRVGAAASRPVVEARPAGEAKCCTERGTDRRGFVPPPSAVADAPSVLQLGNGPAWAAMVRSFGGPGPRWELARVSSSIRLAQSRPSRLHQRPRGSGSMAKQRIGVSR